MPRQNVARVAFNRGKVSPLALSRTDIERVELSAEEQTNWVPRVLGSMMLRPGWKHLGSTLSDSQAFLIPFVKSTDDTAFVEFTNESIRVWEDDTPITRTAVSTTIKGGDFGSDFANFTIRTDPASPGANANGIAFSPDGTLCAVAHGVVAPSCLSIYSVSDTTFTELTTGITSGGSDGFDIAFSPDGLLVALSHNGAAGFEVWSITGTGSSATFASVTTPTLDPGTTAQGISFSPDGEFLAVAHATSPFITIYEISGTGASATFTALADPANLPAGTGNGVAFSQDSRFMAVAHTTTPFITIYEINGTTFTKLADPGTLPAGTGMSVTFSRDGLWMAVAHTTTPFIIIYGIDGTTFTAEANPGTLPDGNGRGVAFSSDNQFLTVVGELTPFLSHYRNVSGTWTKQTDPATPPDGTGNRVAFSPNNRIMAAVHDTANYITVYFAYQWLDMDGSGAASTYGSASPGAFGNTFSNALSVQSPVVFGASGATIRQVITNGALTRSGDRIKIRFEAGDGGFKIDKCYIGYQASSGDAYDFASAPTQVTFDDGLAGFTLATTETKESDELVFGIVETDDNIIVSYHIADSTNDRPLCSSAVFSSVTPYYKDGTDDSATVNATGYTSLAASRDSIGINRIQITSSITGGSGLFLTGTNYNDARRTQSVSVLNADKTTEHGIRLTITQGLVQFHVGTEFGDDDLVARRELGPGVYSFAFTPNVNLFFVELHSFTKYSSIVSSCQIDGSGDLTIGTPYTSSDLTFIRNAQSGDIVYVACKDVEQQKVMRFGDHSWGVADYLPEDGPFRDENTDFTTLTASALTGDITVTASKNYFKPLMVGTLFRISSTGQATSDSFTAQNQFSDPIKVTGVDTARNLSVVRAGTWVATITLQRSISEPGNWTDVATFTANGTATYNDDLDNQIIYYRIGIKTGDYTSGTADVDMSYSQGTIDGVARVTAYTSPTVVDAIVLAPMGGTTAFEHWSEGIWSEHRGWPTSVAIYEGRLGWAGNDKVILSESDGYENFNDLEEGDAGPIIRSIGEGPVDDIHWLLPLQRLLAGAEGSELSIRSNSFDEPLTPSNFNMKAASTQGSAAVAPLRMDSNGAFVERSGTRLYQLAYNFDTYDYSASDLTRLSPDIGEAGIKKIVLQRHPDTRIHCVLEDGTVAILVFEPDEKVVCWVVIETDGLIEDVVVLPQEQLEDAVYYVVNRTIGGLTKRYVEKWALESECQGGTKNKQADSFIEYTSISTATLTGLDHLEGETVVIWADGKDYGTQVVASGSVTIADVVSNAIVGLTYRARYKSTKLAYAAAGGTALNQRKRITGIGLILYNTHHEGLRIGDNYSFLRALPTVIGNKAVVADTIHSEFDWDSNAYNTKWSPDARFCLEANAPLPVTVLGATLEMETNG